MSDDSANTITMHPLLVSAERAAELLGIGERTLWRAVSRGELPKPVKLTGRTLWRTADLARFVDSLGEGD